MRYDVTLVGLTPDKMDEILGHLHTTYDMAGAPVKTEIVAYQGFGSVAVVEKRGDSE